MPHYACFGIAVIRSRLFARDDILACDQWTDQDDDMTCLEATVTDNYISGSDPTLQVRAPDGVNWTIELASRVRNRDAGLTEAGALPGDPVKVVGRRLHQFGENRIKALRLTIAGTEYDLCPDALTPS